MTEYVPVVDISEYQGAYDFAQAIQEGVEGFLFRVSHGNHIDTRVRENYNDAINSGYHAKDLGFYSFLNPKRGSAVRTAQWAIAAIKDITSKPDIVYMVDVENYVRHSPYPGTGGLAPAAFSTYIQGHISEVRRLLPKAVVIGYSNNNFWNGPIGPQDADLADSLDWMVPRYPVHGTDAYEEEGYPPSPATNWAPWALSFTDEYPQEPLGAEEWAGWQFSADYNQQGHRYGASSRDLDLNIVRRDYWEAWTVPDDGIRYPYGYGTGTKTMAELRARYEPKMHPEYARRLFNWIEGQGGNIGIGSGWRDSQPALPGFAPEGKSFHQYQAFPSGNSYAAVDLVAKVSGSKHRAPNVSEAPQQGSDEANVWGVHINVGSAGSPGYESWHMQPVELDGWGSWFNAGQPDIEFDYPIPGDEAPTVPDIPTTPPTLPPIFGDDMNSFVVHDGVRLYDSRTIGSGRRKSGTIKITPADLTPVGAGIVLNITVLDATAPGFGTVWSGHGDAPNVSQVNYAPEDTSPKNGFAVTEIHDDGTFSVYLKGATQVVVDQVGYLEEVEPTVEVTVDNDIDIDVDMIIEAAVDSVIERLENG